MSALILSLGALSPGPATAQSSLPPLSSSGSSGSSGSSNYTSPGGAGDRTHALAVGGRDTLVSLPAGYDPGRRYPVLLVYGGLGASPEEVARTTGLRPASDAIIAYARGVGDAWAGAPYSKTSMGQDVAYSRAIVGEVAKRYSVNRSRVYAIGHSNGGSFALSLACRAPDLLAGAVSVSGMFYGQAEQGCGGGGIPVMFIHADNDDIARINGGVRNGASYMPVFEVFQRWGKRNGCLPLSAFRPAFADDAEHRYWKGCGSATEIVVSDSGGHPWPRHAPALAWDFLSRQIG